MPKVLETTDGEQTIELEEGDEDLLRQFYDELMPSSFPIDDERESFESMLDGLKRSDPMTEYRFILAVVHKADSDGWAVAGGICFEYYIDSNCTVVTYITTSPKHRRSGLGSHLMKTAVEACHKKARDAYDQHEGCALVLAETNADELTDDSTDIISCRQRHSILHKMGFRKLPFVYVQPALSSDQEPCFQLLLTAHISSAALDRPAASSDLQPQSESCVVGTSVVQRFLRNFFAYLQNHGAEPETNERLLQLVEAALCKNATLVLGELPWDADTDAIAMIECELKQHSLDA